jgi:hypothetical protein
VVQPRAHGAMTGVFKSQIDWLPLEVGSLRPTQGRTLAVMQVCGGSQSFNAVNALRVLGRWMRMVTIPNQSSVAKAFQEFDEAGRMKPRSAYYDRVVDVMEELFGHIEKNGRASLALKLKMEWHGRVKGIGGDWDDVDGAATCEGELGGTLAEGGEWEGTCKREGKEWKTSFKWKLDAE